MLPKAVRSPQALRGRRLHRGARRRPRRRDRRAARRALRPRRRARPRGGPRPRRAGADASPRRCASSRRQATRPRALLQPRGLHALPRRARARRRATTGRARAHRREAGRRRAAASGASTPRSTCGRTASTTTAARRTSSAWATCTARSAPGLWHKGERKQAIEHYQKGINLLKDGPPRLELVRLYEEAAWLYMHTGDNMLAIYAAEKALRLAERLGETRAASRAHGIFGRVFGRIGDTAKARENLERVGRAGPRLGRGETIRALLTLGHHLEICEADYAAAERAYGQALDLAQRVGDVPAQVELHAALAQLAVYRADWDGGRGLDRRQRRARRARGPGGQALPAARAAGRSCAGATATGRRPSGSSVARTSSPSRSAGRRSRSRRCSASRLVLRDRGDYGERRRRRSPRPSTSASAPGLIAQSIQAMSARAVVLALAGRTRRRGRPPRRPPRWPSGCTTRSARRRRSRPRASTAEDPDEARRLLGEARGWTALGRPLEAARPAGAGKRLASVATRVPELLARAVHWPLGVPVCDGARGLRARRWGAPRRRSVASAPGRRGSGRPRACQRARAAEP